MVFAVCERSIIYQKIKSITNFKLICSLMSYARIVKVFHTILLVGNLKAVTGTR